MTAIIYAPEKGSVAKVASVINKILGSDSICISIKNFKIKDIESYDKIIFGISTIGRNSWNSDYTDNDWDVFFDKLKDINWEGKTVAVFGLGDQVNYPNNFVDAIGWLYDKLKSLNVNIVGFVENTGYDFIESEALRENKFVGLPIDEDNEPEKSEDRIKKWLKSFVQPLKTLQILEV